MLVACLVLCAPGCGPDVVAIVGSFEAGRAADDGGASDASGVSADGGEGPARCPAQLAAEVLQHALCTCGGANLVVGGLSTDAFDSRLGPYDTRTLIASAGHVGITGSFIATDLFASMMTIDGDMSLTQIAAPGLLPALSVRGDLRVAGPFSYLASVDVGGDLILESDLLGPGALRVAGDLRQPEGAARDPALSVQLGGSDLRGPVVVPAPCPCEAARALDVAALVADAKAHNDNSAAAFDADALAEVIAEQRSLVVDGRLFASSIDVAGSLSLVVRRPAALYVAGDMNIAGALELEIAPEGSLDVFVSGSLFWGGAQSVRGAARPAQLRVYVADDRQVALGIPTGFFGHLYAPGADVGTTMGTVYGSILARELFATLPLAIHRDLGIAAAGADCERSDL